LQRVQYKLCLLVTGQAPDYLTDLLAQAADISSSGCLCDYSTTTTYSHQNEKTEIDVALAIGCQVT